MTRKMRIAPVAIAVACAVGGAVACHEPSDPLSTALGLGPRVPIPGQVRDPEINVHDSYYSTDVTITTTVQSGAAVHALAVPPAKEQLHFEGGYDASGAARTNVYVDAAPTVTGRNRLGAHLIQLAHGKLSRYDSTGSLISSSAPPISASLLSDAIPGDTAIAAATQNIGRMTMDSTAVLHPPTGMLAERTSATEVRWVGARPSTGTLPPDTSVTVYDLTTVGTDANGASIDRWALARVEHALHSAGTVTRSAETMTFSHTRENLNRPADSSRAVATRAALNTTRAAARASKARAVAVRNAEPVPSLTAIQSTVAPSFSAMVETTRRPYRFLGPVDSLNEILYIHGMLSDATTWDGMTVHLDSLYTGALGTTTVNTNWREPIGEQADDIASVVSGSHYLVVGHSLGGLVARSLGQRYPQLVRGVITIGTPHNGAPLADVGHSQITSVLGAILQELPVCQQMFHPACRSMASMGASIIDDLLSGLVGAVAPSLEDVRPGSVFLSELNGRPESFQRASIEVTIPERWQWARLFGDYVQRDTKNMLNGGQTWADLVEDVDVTAHVTEVLAYVAADALDGDFGGFDAIDAKGMEPCITVPYYSTCDEEIEFGWGEPDAVSDWVWDAVNWITSVASSTYMWLEWMDDMWDSQVTGSTDGDGFIAAASQAYPATPGPTPLHFGIGYSPESHTGETNSRTVLKNLYSATLQLGTVH